LDSGERYWFDDSESQLIIAHNSSYQQLSPAEMCFNELFQPATTENDGQWLTTAAIFNYLRRQTRSIIPPGGLTAFGRALSHMSQLRRKRSMQGTCYLVKQR
ncbi:MAG: DUF3874 domain-containing protein, partial [Prevotella sp.]|nr:DUF3874 domain-containing protein [Prevotella sp.]